MPQTWTTDQILALAPDDKAAKAGEGLATARQWVSLGCSEQAAWGECQGSAKNPYQAQIDLGEPAFKCSCPSRKFPCKHALGLFLLLAAHPEAFTRAEPPEWVASWLAGRARRGEQRAQREERPKEAADLEARARRAAQRHARVAAGLQELEVWLRDLVRNGLASVHGQSLGFWHAPAARMVDAQAPGVARMLQDMAGIPASREGWQARLLDRVGRLYLLLEAFKRLDSLSPETQADVRALIGWTESQEELLAETGQRDVWLILGQRVEDEDRLRVQRTWLWGRETGGPALVLPFAAAGQSLDPSLVPGTCVDAELVFFHGAYPLRALIKSRAGPAAPLDDIPGYPTFSAFLETYGRALALCPWVERFPAPLQSVRPVRLDGRWGISDAEGRILAIPPAFHWGWQLLALSGGHPLALFGEWNGERLLPLSAWSQGRFVLMESPP
jgi:hypothetical protein